MAVFTLETDNPCGRIIRLVHFPSWCEFEMVFFSQARLQFHNIQYGVHGVLSSVKFEKKKLVENNLHVTLYRKASRRTTMETLHGKHSFYYAASGVLLATLLGSERKLTKKGTICTFICQHILKFFKYLRKNTFVRRLLQS